MTARRIRSFFAVLCVLALLVGASTPAFASSNRSMAAMMTGTDPVSPTFDLLVLRPLGLVGVVGGFGLFILSSPIVLITRPHEIGTPFKNLVIAPAKYVWADPLGEH
jgi:hypothetical protein